MRKNLSKLVILIAFCFFISGAFAAVCNTVTTLCWMNAPAGNCWVKPNCEITQAGINDYFAKLNLGVTTVGITLGDGDSASFNGTVNFNDAIRNYAPAVTTVNITVYGTLTCKSGTGASVYYTLETGKTVNMTVGESGSNGQFNLSNCITRNIDLTDEAGEKAGTLTVASSGQIRNVGNITAKTFSMNTACVYCKATSTSNYTCALDADSVSLSGQRDCGSGAVSLDQFRTVNVTGNMSMTNADIRYLNNANLANGFIYVGGNLSLNNARIHNQSPAPITVAGNLTISGQGNEGMSTQNVGAIRVTGNMTLTNDADIRDSKGAITVTGNLNSTDSRIYYTNPTPLAVNGNLTVTNQGDASVSIDNVSAITVIGNAALNKADIRKDTAGIVDITGDLAITRSRIIFGSYSNLEVGGNLTATGRGESEYSINNVETINVEGHLELNNAVFSEVAGDIIIGKYLKMTNSRIYFNDNEAPTNQNPRLMVASGGSIGAENGGNAIDITRNSGTTVDLEVNNAILSIINLDNESSSSFNTTGLLQAQIKADSSQSIDYTNCGMINGSGILNFSSPAATITTDKKAEILQNIALRINGVTSWPDCGGGGGTLDAIKTAMYLSGYIVKGLTPVNGTLRIESLGLVPGEQCSGFTVPSTFTITEGRVQGQINCTAGSDQLKIGQSHIATASIWEGAVGGTCDGAANQNCDNITITYST